MRTRWHRTDRRVTVASSDGKQLVSQTQTSPYRNVVLRALFGHGVVVLVLAALCPSVDAQQGQYRTAQPTRTQPGRTATSPAGAEQLSRQAYQSAQTAKTLEELTESLRICSNAMKASPTPGQKKYIQELAGWIYNKRGEALVRLAEQTAATDEKRSAEYEQAAANDFDLSVRFDNTRWKSRFNRAISKAMVGDYDAALLDLNFVLEQEPNHKNAHFNRAEILLQRGEYEQAVMDYGQVVTLDPQDAAAYAGRGIALAAIGRTDEAVVDLNAVVRLEPENASAYVDRADLYAAMGDWKRAASDYRVAIKLDGESARAYQNVAWLMATCPEEQYREPALAVKAAKRAIDLQGPTYLGLDTYAAALASAGDYARAISAQQQAMNAAPPAERQMLASRLALYRQRQPYLEPLSTDSNVRLASAEEEVE